MTRLLQKIATQQGLRPGVHPELPGLKHRHNTALQTFVAGIDELQALLNDAERQSRLIGLLISEPRLQALEEEERMLLLELSQARTDRKRYMYAVTIVSLYGLMERLVDNLVERFVSRVSELVPSYDMMPEAIKKHHVALSLDLVKAIIDDRFKRDATQEQVIANLHSCISGAADFEVNGAAFVLHRGNVSLSKITGYLASVGIEAPARKNVSTEAFHSYLAEAEPERNLENISDQEIAKLLDPIDDLVERRNEVSHGVINVDDIESIDLLQKRCAFIHAYGRSLFEVLEIELLRFEVGGSSAQPLGKPLAVYRSSVACFEHSDCKINEGDILVASTPAGILPYRRSPILSIEINKVRHSSIDVKTATCFGVEVSFVAHDTYEYIVLPRSADEPLLRAATGT